MKISEMIAQLEEQKKKLGDIEVTVNIDGFGGHASYTTSGIDESALHPADVCENDTPNIEEIKQFWPEWKGTAEEFFDDADIEVITLEIRTGRMLYST